MNIQTKQGSAVVVIQNYRQRIKNDLGYIVGSKLPELYDAHLKNTHIFMYTYTYSYIHIYMFKKFLNLFLSFCYYS